MAHLNILLQLVGVLLVLNAWTGTAANAWTGTEANAWTGTAANGWTGTEANAASDDDILTRLAVVETQQRVLLETVVDQRNTIDKQATKLNALEQEMTTLNVSQNRQSEQFQENERWLLSLLKTDQLPTAVLDGDESNAAVPSALRRQVNVSSGNAVPSGHVAFTAFLDHAVDVALHSVIKYNRILTNDGTAYNPLTGIFTCGEAGMYMFHYTVSIHGYRNVRAALMVNSQNTVGAVAEGFYSSQDLQGSNMVMKSLSQGDSVWIESLSDNDHIVGTETYRYATFSGMFLY